MYGGGECVWGYGCGVDVQVLMVKATFKVVSWFAD